MAIGRSAGNADGAAVAGPASSGEQELAHGTLGTAHIVFMVMAAIAPAAGAVGLLPLAIGLGDGVGTPGSVLLVGVILLVFAVGFTRMVPLIRNAGAFYAYVRKGMGPVGGLVAAFIALASYIGISAAVVGAFSFFAKVTFVDLFGIDLAWPVWAVLCVVGVLALAYFRVTLAAGVLTALFLAEFAAVLVLDIAVLVKEGPGNFTGLGVFDPSNVFVSGTIGVALIYGFSFFQGFEGTAIYAEEAKDPARTVPRATYLAIGGITVWYIVTSWALLVGAGGEDAPGRALADPGAFVYALSDSYVGHTWTDLLKILIVTSMFAGVLAFHNASTRYMFSLARDGFLPSALARVHPTQKSPTVANGVSAGLVLLVSLSYAVAGLDPLTSLSTSLTGFGAVGVLVLITATSLSVAAYFLRQGKRTVTHVLLPVIGTAGVGTGLYFSLANYSVITGTTDALINNLPWVHVVIALVVIAMCLHVRRTDPRRWVRASGADAPDG